MSTTISQHASNYREGRRLRAWELHQQGWSQTRIAQALGVTQGAVSQWLKRLRSNGPQALRHHPAPGPQPRLSPQQLEHLTTLLARGPLAFGFSGEVWTTTRVAKLIKDNFAVSYHPAHVSRLLPALGWSVQKPITRATQRDEAAVRDWYERRWPRLKKARREERTIVWVDEAGFYLLPGQVRTYAPRTQTPVLRVPLTQDHLSASSAITRDGRLLLKVQHGAIRGADVVRFLKHLLRHIAGKVLIIWDGIPTHRAKEVQEFLRAGASKRLHLEQLPVYAPDLNADEGVWNYLKRVELKNVCCHDLAELLRELRSAVVRLRHKVDVLRGCVSQCGY